MRGSLTRIRSGHSRRNKNTMNTHTSIQYYILSVKYSYYTLGLSIRVTKGLKSKDASKDNLKFAGVISLIVQVHPLRPRRECPTSAI
jgi:hypothetical protein